MAHFLENPHTGPNRYDTAGIFGTLIATGGLVTAGHAGYRALFETPHDMADIEGIVGGSLVGLGILLAVGACLGQLKHSYGTYFPRAGTPPV